MTTKCTKNLALNDDFASHMFGPLKEALGGQRFDDDEQVENFVRNWLQTRPPPFYGAGLKKTPNPLAKMHREG